MEEQNETPAELYLELLKKCLTRIAFEEPYQPLQLSSGTIKSKAVKAFQTAVGRRGLELVWKAPPPSGRDEGRDWPVSAETMIGLKRLDNLQFCVSDVIKRGIPGDVIETGVWRGGASIFMRAVLRAYGDRTRKVWVADSFQGLPDSSGKYDADTSNQTWAAGDLAVSASEVRANFARYGLLDDQVQFIEGFFQDTLAEAPIEQLAVARLDGDLYESTIVALEALYPKLSVGGYLIIDDYFLENCRQAVEDFRRDNQITEPITEIDWTGVYWRREA
ncbi:MAG TPA: TylF/MycF/NovP-related O-methyltransferase [Gaiellaceae bacterium]|nr:TylF/MycF/NovP-related O-methyltransferase [Gaiellaceae bacterium]